MLGDLVRLDEDVALEVPDALGDIVVDAVLAGDGVGVGLGDWVSVGLPVTDGVCVVDAVCN